MKIVVLPLVLAASVATIAAPAQAETFNGPYVGVTAGWDRGEFAKSTVGSQSIDARVSRDSLILGGYAGYNYKVTDRIVIGAEAGLAGTTNDRARAVSSGRDLTIDPRYSFDLTARAGYLVSDKALVYVRGGYANNRARTTLSAPTGLVRQTANLDGWVVGGGLEYVITERVSARVEYRFSDLGRDGGTYDRHQTLVGVSYNF